MNIFRENFNSVSAPVLEVDIEDYSFLNYPDDYFIGAYELGPYLWEKKIDTTGLTPDELEDVPEPELMVTMAIIQDPTRDQFNVGGGSIPATGVPGIDVIIEVPKNFRSQKYSELYEELKITVMHEIEHLTQQSDFLSYERDERYYINPETSGLSPWAKDYLLAPDEIAAHVVGYADVASSFVDLEKRISRDLSGYVKQGKIDEDDKSAVLSTWIGWAKEHLKQKRFL